MSALFVDHLTVMDFTYLDAERGLVGESWIVDVVLQGELDANGMVFDFGDVKKQIKRAIDDCFDHKFVVPADLPGLTVEDISGTRHLRWTDRTGRRWHHEGPAGSTALLPAAIVDMEGSARWLEARLRSFLPPNVDAIRLTLRTEPIDGAFYHYTHGLKKHQGNCQRIAHGHRSRLEICLDGRRDPALEERWAARWRDIYIGTREDIVDEFETEGVAYVRFAYEGSQGNYGLTLPRACVYLIDCDSTVELIADHLADEVALVHPGRAVAVRAFEGVWKGALAHR
jgi:6-pyruvoyl-tetrahydropterin synthase